MSTEQKGVRCAGTTIVTYRQSSFSNTRLVTMSLSLVCNGGVPHSSCSALPSMSRPAMEFM